MKNQANFKLSTSFDKIFASKYRLLIIAGIILLCWLPILVAMFPGTAVNDTWSQMDRFVTLAHGGTINDHHPILDTLLTGGYVTCFVKLFGNWDLAFFSYVLLQSVITSLALAYSIIYAHEKLSLGRKPVAIFLAIYSLFPVFPLIVQTLSKDAIFCWVYVLFFVQFIELVRTKGDLLKNKKSLALFILTVILCALTKKIGLYVVSGSLLITIFFFRSVWKQILASIGSVLIMMFLVMPFVLGIFKIEKGGLQEMLSLPFQMTARYAVMYDDATEAEVSAIENVLGDYELLPQKYVPNNADPVKGGEQLGQDGDYTKYIEIWLGQGLRHPDAYFAATFDMLAGWFSFNEFKPLMNMDWHNLITENSYADEAQTHRHAFFEKTSRLLERIYDFVYTIPMVGIIFSFGFYATILPLVALVWLIISRKKYSFLAFIPLGLSIILGCWLAPVSDVTEGSRYLFPIVFSVPMMLTWCIYSWKTRNSTPSKMSAKKAK